MVDETKPDVILSTKREIFFDLDKITYAEILGAADINETAIRTDETIAKAAGITLDEIKACSAKDYKRLVRAFWDKWREPLNDPND